MAPKRKMDDEEKAYGNWSWRDGIKGHPTGPVKGFAKVLAKRATVLPMEEYCTSKLCSSCHQPLLEARLLTKEKIKKNKKDDSKKPTVKTPTAREVNKRKKQEETEQKATAAMRNPALKKSFRIVMKTTHNVLCCATSSCKASFWNRDVNAARNMLELMKGYFRGVGRLPAFVRGA